MDRSLVESAGIPFFGIPAGKLRRYFSLKNFFDPLKIAGGFFAARRILKREKPALLFSKGGFVSVPPCAAAASLGIPVFTHESDYSPGLATRLNARFAALIFTAYQDSAAFFPAPLRRKIRVAGNPIRPEFAAADPVQGREFLSLPPEERILLVLGGSQGARELNELVREGLPLLTRVYTVVHQTGFQNNGDPAAERYRPFPFLRDELPHLIAASELVLCRAGAGTVWENAALGKPMLLLPLRGSGTRGDQVENARALEKAGAALVFSGEGGGKALGELVLSLAGDGEKRRAMADAARGFASAGGAELIAGAIIAAVEKE
jgi:UDP-N-acetylglucosamine--N-acetylmuramyl-(pentapeptide) pyrophosphoryl-undecaprenol N-acetylglucosamine transferase